MMHFLYCLIIQPLYMLFEFLFENIIVQTNNNICLTILLMSFIVSLLCLPLYLRADALQQEETDIQKKLSKKTKIIKDNYKGDERIFLLQTLYRQNNYHPIMGLRLSLSLLLQIPIFIAAYTFFCHLNMLHGMDFGLVENLSKPDGILRFHNLSINVLPILMTVVNIQAGYIYADSKSFKDNKVLIIISLVFLVLLYNSPAALVLYWLFNNVFSLFKNILLRVCTHENLIKYVFSFALVTYYIYEKIFIQKYDVICLIFVLAVLAFMYLKPKKLNSYNFDFGYKKIFILSMLSFLVFVGVLVPSNVVSTSPVEFIFDDSSPLRILLYAATVMTGFSFWGFCIYYFSSTNLRKLLSVLLYFVLLCSIANIYILKLPVMILTSELTFEAAMVKFNMYTVPQYLLFALLVGAGVLVFIYSVLKKRENIISNVLSIFIVTCLSISLYNYFNVYQKNALFLKNNPKVKFNYEPYVNLSKTNKNVFVIFVDRAIGSYLPIIFKEHPQLNEQFRGFTYYPNTLSYAGYTMVGYLPILGGYEYVPFNFDSREGGFNQKLDEAITVLPAIFSTHNYKTRIINPMENSWGSSAFGALSFKQIKKFTHNNMYEQYNIEHLTTPESIIEGLKGDVVVVDSSLTKRNLIYFSFFSVAPPFARAYIYNNGKYHSTSDNVEIKYKPDFLQSYAELLYLPKITELNAKTNTFTVFNNSLPHAPCLLKYPNYDLSENNLDTYIPPILINDDNWSLKHYHVNVAALKLLGDYFDYLRKNNVYDNTRIIIVADHGYGYNLQNPYMGQFEADNYLPYNPLLMVKDFNSNGRWKTNKEFMTNADVPLIATKGIIKNPINPFTKNGLAPDKERGVIIKHDVDWQPNNYLGKAKMLKKTDVFNYVKGDPLNHDNWKVKLSYQEAWDLYRQSGGK